MTAAQAAQNSAVVRRLSKASGARQEAVRRVLLGLEVWTKTYEDVCSAAELAEVTDVPPLAPRAPRRGPCEECARLRERVAELVKALADLYEAGASLVNEKRSGGEYGDLVESLEDPLDYAHSLLRNEGMDPEKGQASDSTPALVKIAAPRTPRIPLVDVDKAGAETPIPLVGG